MEEYEQDFLIAVYRMSAISTVRDLIARYDLPDSRCYYLLRKWKSKEWYEHTDALDLGQLTDKGRKVAQSYIELSEKPELALCALLAYFFTKASKWDFVETITARIEQPTVAGGTPTAYVGLTVKGSGSVKNVFTIEQIRSIGIEMTVKGFRRRVKDYLLGERDTGA